MNAPNKTGLVLRALALLFITLAVAFLVEAWGKPTRVQRIPLVDPAFVDTATARRSYADLKQAGEDLSDFDCYGCHQKGKPPVIKFDAAMNIIIPSEHKDIVMGHGRHNRNNNCFNCHDEHNLELLQTRDGHELSFDNSAPLCGSCHGPTYRDWEAGAHGRPSGTWNRDPATFKRPGCPSCHNPHAPKFPGRKPAPGPHPLRLQAQTQPAP